MKLILATGNQGKLRELKELLADTKIEVRTQSEFGIEPPEETGLTFAENAILKARHAALYAQLPAVADDSGLEVDALQGRPGIYSARYAGLDASDAENNRKLLDELRDVPPERRTARYRCALALLRSATDASPLVCEGMWAGHIAAAPQGEGGFGYDPLFVVEGQGGRSAAQLSAELKNRLSHRGQALRQLVVALKRLDAS